MRTPAATHSWTAVVCVVVAGAACSKRHDTAPDASPDLSDAVSPADDASSDDSSGEPPLDDAGTDAAAGPDAGPDSSVEDALGVDAASHDSAVPWDDAWVEGGPSEIIAGTSYAEAEAFGDAPASHTHVLFGSETLYISHLPAWSGPHAYQAETAITMDDGARAVYLQDRASSGTLLYTVLPEPFTLPSLIAPDAGSLTWSTDVYRGNLEDNGKHIASGTLSAPRSVHFRHLDPTTPRPAEPAYLLFGSSTEAFLVHLFTTQPDFGQILAVELPPALAADPRLASGIQLRLPGQDPKVPLDAGATPAVRIADTGNVTTLKVVAEVFRDLADLQ